MRALLAIVIACTVLCCATAPTVPPLPPPTCDLCPMQHADGGGQ